MHFQSALGNCKDGCEHKGLFPDVIGRIIVYILIVGIKASSVLFLLKCSSTEPLTSLLSLSLPHHY